MRSPKSESLAKLKTSSSTLMPSDGGATRNVAIERDGALPLGGTSRPDSINFQVPLIQRISVRTSYGSSAVPRQTGGGPPSEPGWAPVQKRLDVLTVNLLDLRR